MLTVTQKIASEADAEAILKASYRLSAPLGIPTLIIDPADYQVTPPHMISLLLDPIENRVMRQVQRMLYKNYGSGDPHVREFMRDNSKFRTTFINALERAVKGNPLAAHSFTEGNLFNLLICPRTHDTGALIVERGLGIDAQKIPDMPGHNAQWNFIKLWHEFGHGLDIHEARADHVAAVIHQYVFADSAPLMAFSDFRAAKTIIKHEHTDKIKIHGWHLVDTIDDVLNADIPLTWKDATTQSLLPLTADPKILDVQFVGRSLMNVSRLAFTEPDLLMLGMMADHMAYKGNVENENQLRIARRFAIAAQRLSIGKNAYAVTQPKPSI